MHTQATAANLQGLTRDDLGDVQCYEGFQAGGGGMVTRQALLQHHADLSWRDGLAITLHQPGAHIEAVVQTLQPPHDWQPFDQLEARITAHDQPLRIELTIVGARCLLGEVAPLSPGQTATVRIDLIDLPLAAGNREMYKPTAVRVTALWDDASQPRLITVHSLQLHRAAATAPPRPTVDRFGQRASRHWPSKVTDDAQFQAQREAEARELAQMTPPPDRDRFGGWTAGQAHNLAFKPTGFFRVEQDPRGCWWLIDPLGNPFWSVGSTGVRLTDATPVQHRPHVYEQLPDPDGPLGPALMPEGMGFYHQNILRKYGSVDAWRDRVIQRFKTWGFNTICNWSGPMMLDQPHIPHVRTLRTRSLGVRATKGLPDVFDPSWEREVRQLMAEEIPPHRDNPWLIGWFVDNEWGWRSCKLLTSPQGLLLRERWIAFIRERYVSLDAFNADFATHFTDWAQVQAMSHDQLPPAVQQRDADHPAAAVLRDFESIYAQRYFSLIESVFREHDTNHLYMGCRFTKMPPHRGIVEAAGRYVDVLSVNCYSWAPEREIFDQWYAGARKPILIGEHHAPLASDRQLPPLYPAFTPQQRHEYYHGYLHAFAQMPYSLGCHWFQHADQPPTGRHTDGECQSVGFVDITDQPHQELVTALRDVAQHIYHWHTQAQ